MTNYILDGKTPVPCDDIHEWGRQFTDADRIVARTEEPKYLVSTVFLGSDHSFGFGGPPVVFETMIFADDLLNEEYQERYCTWEEAEAGHKRAIEYAERRIGC